jgi:hypothetical protein
MGTVIGLGLLASGLASAQSLSKADREERLETAAREATFVLYEKHGARWRIAALLRACKQEGIAATLNQPFEVYADDVVAKSHEYKISREELIPMSQMVNSGVRWYMVGAIDGMTPMVVNSQFMCTKALEAANKFLLEDRNKNKSR